ncbi:SIR2 family protein [Aeromonas hydrophila]|uniref:SIR2 family protein n=1 Tax=Aeromonas hydrophila TaxID=644 RepID=UPI003EC8C8F6
MAPEEVESHLRLIKTRGGTHHFVSAAEDVTSLMGGVESKHFEEWLAQTIGTIKAHDRKTLDALEALRAKGNLLATTNYDGLLLDDAGTLKPVTWKDPDAFLRAARNREPDKVIYLHGYWRQPATVILDWNSYQEIARDERYRDELATIWHMTTWLYVGCGVNGLNDPDFGLLLERYGKRARDADLWDFCLVRSDQREQFQAHFDKFQLNICAVSFGDSYDKLPDYLRSLSPDAVATPAVAAVVLPPAEPIIEFLRLTDSFFQYRAPATSGGSVMADSRGDFRFTAEEFRTGAVHRAQVVEVALRRLRHDGCVWLEGPSAGGKTTVCLHLVAEWNHQGCEPLYLDLADEPDSEKAARELAAHAKPGRMFILDNVHEHSKLACTLLDQWKTQRRDSVMILMGWPAAVKPDHDYLSGHRAAIVPVTVQPEDWIGVYQSTFRQIRGSGHVAPVPPPCFVKEWDDIFAADLVTFQYALAAGLRLDGSNVFRVEQAAADRHVREKYLTPCSEEERRDLFRLAWFTELSVSLGEEAVPSKFTRSQDCGLVRTTLHGRFKDHVRFQPWHRSFGRLLLRLSSPGEREQGLCEGAALHPFCAGIVAKRLCWQGEKALGARLLEHTLRAKPSLVDWFGENLTFATKLLQQIKMLVPARWEEICKQLNEPDDKSRLLAQAFATPLGDLVNFLRFSGQSSELKPVQDALVKALATDAQLPDDKSCLLAQAFATPLHFLVTFLQFTGRTKGLEPVQDALVKALTADAQLLDDKSRLIQVARDTKYANLRGFVNGSRAIPKLSAVADKIESDAVCAKILEGKS